MTINTNQAFAEVVGEKVVKDRSLAPLIIFLLFDLEELSNIFVCVFEG